MWLSSGAVICLPPSLGPDYGTYAAFAFTVSQDGTARYFAVHAAFNTVMVITCAPDVYRVLMVCSDLRR